MNDAQNNACPNHPKFLFLVRTVIAVIWLYEGLWQKVIAQNNHELSVVQQFTATLDGARRMMTAIGLLETLLAIGVFSGLLARPLAWFQIVALVAMNLIGIFFGGGTIAEPVGLIVHNLPLLCCMALIGFYGPGAFALGARLRHE